MECCPFETAVAGEFPSRSQWDAAAADLVATMLARWNLTAGEPFVGGEAACVLRVSRSDGSPAVLKIGYPHVEATWEAVGLEAAAGLAPAVYRQDAWTWSMLLEELAPGTPMSRAQLTADEALVAGAELLARLHARAVPPGIPTLADAMGAYAAQARGRMPGQAAALDALGIRGLVDRAIADLVDLAATGPGTTLLHGDFNPGNLLLDDRRGWLAIDPKPMSGDPAFDLWPLVSQLGTDIAHNLAVASDAAGVDAERAARWSFARTGINVSWYLAEGMFGQAESEAKALRAWARLLDA